MKRHYLMRRAAIACAASALFSAAPTLFAQFGGGGFGGRGPGPMQNLTPEQQAAVMDFNNAVTQAGAPVNEKLTAARAELADAIFAAKLDEAKIKEKAAAVAKLEEELNFLRAKEFDRSRAKLSNTNAIAALKAIAQGGGGRGGFGGRGGAGGGAPGGGGRGVRGRGGGAPVLSDLQQTEVTRLEEAVESQTAEVGEARRALFGAIYADKTDEAAIKTKIEALAAAELKEARGRAEAFQKLQTSEQKLGPEQVKALIEQSGRGGGGRGGRGGFGGF